MSETLEQKIERLVEAIKDCAHHVTAWQQISIGYHNALAAAQAELDKQKSAVWRPEEWDNAWLLRFSGRIDEARWEGGGYDQGAYSQGNVFPTREAAERERDRRMLIADMRRWAAENGVSVTWRPLVRDPISFKLAREMSDLFDDRLHLLND